MKIKFNSDDDLPSVFEDDSKLYPQVFLDDSFMYQRKRYQELVQYKNEALKNFFLLFA